MTRFLLCLSSILLGAFVAGCASNRLPSLKLSQEVSGSAGSSNSIAWGVIALREVWDTDSGYARVQVPGLLPTLGVPIGDDPSADMIFRDEATGKEFTTRVVSINQTEQLFACALPEGQYRLTIQARLPWARLTCVSDAPVRSPGDGNAIYIGFLKFAISRNAPLLYDATSASPGERAYTFEEALNKFRADNPTYIGQVTQQKIARGVTGE